MMDKKKNRGDGEIQPLHGLGGRGSFDKGGLSVAGDESDFRV